MNSGNFFYVHVISQFIDSCVFLPHRISFGKGLRNLELIIRLSDMTCYLN